MSNLDARLEAALVRVLNRSSANEDPRLDAFMRAAAVLWRFVPDELQPDDEEPARRHEVEKLLAGKVVRLRPRPGESSASYWTLHDDLRSLHLDGRSPSELARLRSRNASIDGPEQALVDRWFAGADPKLPEYGTEELGALSRIRGWFASPPAHFPSPADLEKLRAAARFRAPLRSLVGGSFCGRAEELERIRRFVSDDVAARPAMLVIRGVGGIGKSTLAAKFLLDTIADNAGVHVLGYLDFDEPKLDISDGVTLVLELSRQASAQFPQASSIREVVDRAVQATDDLAVGDSRAPGRALVVKAATLELAEALGAALRSAGIERVTVVLDTFEEMQYADADHRAFLYEQVATLDAWLPGLRTLVVSRAVIETPTAEHMEVKELDGDSARAYLRSAGLADEEQIQAAVDLAQGNPLSLKLAANVLARLGTQGLQGIDVESALQQELVQGQLYRRILQHVHVPEIQRLAHPGLVVRRVTPELIERVLAEPCGLGKIDGKRARELFEHLSREISLVRDMNDGALEHRADVRRVMLRLLYRDRPQLAREIHQRAADYYSALADDIAIAEEAYHRFALGETDGPWLHRLGANPSAAARLRGALEELPESSWPLIASYTGIDLPPELWAAAQNADVERRVAARIEGLLESDHAEEAIEVLGGRDDVEEAIAILAKSSPRSSNSRLWRWQGRAFALIGRPREALAALERSLASLVGPESQLAEDHRIAVEVARKLDDAEAMARLGGMKSAVRAPVAHVQLRPPEPPAVEDGDGAVRWLDDFELRLLVKETLDLKVDARKAGIASTFASSSYKEVLKLNQTPVRDDGSVPLLEWVGRVQKSEVPSIEFLRKNLKGFVK